jgi:hypothetical protein
MERKIQQVIHSTFGYVQDDEGYVGSVQDETRIRLSRFAVTLHMYGSCDERTTIGTYRAFLLFFYLHKW